MSKSRPLVILLLLVGVVLVGYGVITMNATRANPPAAEVTEQAVTLVPSLVPTEANTIPLPSTISGIVTNDKGPIADATVQIQGTPDSIKTDAKGAFSFSGISGTTPIVVSAWSTGHFVGWSVVNPSSPDWKGGDAINISLKSLPVSDNSEYEGFSYQGVSGSASCGICHREYSEWQADLHSQAAVNPRFITLYTGTDAKGNEGQPVVYGLDGIPQPPDPNEPYYGPGFRLDNPSRAGNCAACHTPMVSTSPNVQNCAWSGCHTSLTIERANGVIDPPAYAVPARKLGLEGINCEFCHKIGDVYLDPETNLPFPDMPGIMSLRLFRPQNESQQVFFGTLVDVTRADSYLPLISQSQFCAGCHFGVFGGIVGMGEVMDGTIIYNSYGEWLESPYSDPDTGKTCQDCHMPVSDANWFVYPEQGGLTRDYAVLHNHTMPGASDENLLQNSVTMTSTAERTGDQLEVDVSITNDRAGHHVPTDAPMRSLILVVEAVDAAGQTLSLTAGPVNPDYSGDYSGVAGKTFAKILKDDWTGESPTAAFWRPVTIVEDTRLPALATDTTHYTFNAPAGSEVTVNVRLLYRREFYELMKQKGWDDPDILMEHETIQVPAN